MTNDRIRLEYNPVAGPRRRITFEVDRVNDLANLEFHYWRIEEVYDTETGRWREVGREHVSEPDLVIETDDVGSAIETPPEEVDR